MKKKAFKPQVFCIFFLLWICNTFAQSPVDLRFERISSEVVKYERGLSQNSIKCIYQDKMGYLWIGTWDGLNRYDGYTFKPYRAISSENPFGLLYSSVTAVLETDDGVFWLGTEQGLTAFEKKTGKFQQFVFKMNNPNTLSNNTINVITQSKNKIIWIGTHEGLCYYDSKKNLLSRFTFPLITSFKKQAEINDIAVDNKNHVWVATSIGLCMIDSSFKLQLYLNSHNSSLCSDVIQCLRINSNEQIWVGTSKGLNLFDIKNNSIVALKEKPSEPPSSRDDIKAVYEDKSGLVWMGTNGSGLIIYDNQNNKFYQYNNQVENDYSLSNDYIQCITPDASGNIWIGTTWKGLNKIDINSVRLSHYYHISESNKSINNNLVWQFMLQTPKNFGLLQRKVCVFLTALKMHIILFNINKINPIALLATR